MFLRQSLETKLAGLFVLPFPFFFLFFLSSNVLTVPVCVCHGGVSSSQIEFKLYRDALTLIEGLLKEVKRLDDKLILTEIHLLESRASSATANWAKAKVGFFLFSPPPPFSDVDCN